MSPLVDLACSSQQFDCIFAIALVGDPVCRPVCVEGNVFKN